MDCLQENKKLGRGEEENGRTRSRESKCKRKGVTILLGAKSFSKNASCVFVSGGGGGMGNTRQFSEATLGVITLSNKRV